MKKISAVICELNPLHLGHKYIFEKAREGSDCVAAVMSGNFVQRGECAVFDKYSRARAALMCGANLVIELPFPWCAAPAEFFARAGVLTAMRAGCDTIVFGSESGDIQRLEKAASLFSDSEFLKTVEKEYGENVGYARARELAALKICPECAEVFSSSNDMLASEYLKSGRELGFSGSFRAVCRTGESSHGYMSASEIRSALYEHDLEKALRAVPQELWEYYSRLSGGAALADKLYDVEYTALRLGYIPKDSFDSAGGIVSRLAACAGRAENGREMLQLAATKKYTNARIKRAALSALCEITKSDLESLPRAAYVLGADSAGREALAELRHSTDFSFVTKPSDADAVCRRALRQNERADRLYTMLSTPAKDISFFMKQKPVIF